MSKNTTVSLTLQLKGTAGAALDRMGRDQVQVAQKVNQTWAMTAKAQGDFVNMSRRATQETKQTATAGDQLLRTNRMLEGVLRQQAIQTRLLGQQLKIQTSDYQRQTRMLSEQARHARDLQRSMAGAAQSQRSMGQSGIGTGGLVQGVAGTAAGVYAASQIVGAPIDRSRTFERSVASITDIATGEMDLSATQRKDKAQQVAKMIWDAVFYGGSSSEGVARGAHALVASGLYNFEQLPQVLPELSKRAFAGETDPEHMAGLMVALKQFGISEQEMPEALTRLQASGKLGGFEISDMSQFFPSLLTNAAANGFKGLDGLTEFASMAQISRRNAATAGMAATNLDAMIRSLGGERLDSELAKNITWNKGDPFKVDAQGNAMKSKAGLPIFDPTQFFVNSRLAGEEQPKALVRLLSRELNQDASYLKLKAQRDAAQAGGASKTEIDNLEAAMSIVSKNLMAKFFVRKEESLGLAPFISAAASGELESLSSRTKQMTNATEDSFAFLNTQESTAYDTLVERRKKAEYDAYMGIADGLTTVKTAIANWMGSNEGLAASATAATTALFAVAAAGGIAAFAMGGGKGVGTIFATASRWLAKGAAPLAAAAGGYNAYQIQNDDSLTVDQKNVAQAGNAGGTVGAMAGAAAGAAIGSAFFGVGALPGAFIGGALGYWGGSSAGEALVLQDQMQTANEQQLAAIEKQTQEIVKALQANQQPREIFGGRSLFNAMNESLSQEALRGAGMPP